jgi:hypothetical protein
MMMGRERNHAASSLIIHNLAAQQSSKVFGLHCAGDAKQRQFPAAADAVRVSFAISSRLFYSDVLEITKPSFFKK